MNSPEKQPVAFGFCRGLCTTSLLLKLREAARDPEASAIVVVLRRCSESRAGLLSVLAELNASSKNASALGSLLNEVRLYHQEHYRACVTKEMSGETLEYGTVLSLWLQEYQTCWRMVT